MQGLGTLDSNEACTLALAVTQRLTSSISLHTFSTVSSENLTRNLRPSQHITLQFAADLDPIGGPRGLSAEERCLTFTPCQLPDSEQKLSLLARNGRVTGLIGLPRPQGPLKAELVGVGGGFASEALKRDGNFTCIAGGTGIACFLAMASGSTWRQSLRHQNSSLYCSIRAEDFPIIRYLLNSRALDPSSWASIKIFVTSGQESGDLADGKSQSWWETHFSEIRQAFPKTLECKSGRMVKDDLEARLQSSDGAVLFCGSKSLEWQIKMWALGGPAVYTTERV